MMIQVFFSIVFAVVTVVAVVIFVGCFSGVGIGVRFLRGTFSFYLVLPGSTLLPLC